MKRSTVCMSCTAPQSKNESIFVNWIYHQLADDNLILLFVEVMVAMAASLIVVVAHLACIHRCYFRPASIFSQGIKITKHLNSFYLAGMKRVRGRERNSINQMCVCMVSINRYVIIICFSVRSFSILTHHDQPDRPIGSTLWSAIHFILTYIYKLSYFSVCVLFRSYIFIVLKV